MTERISIFKMAECQGVTLAVYEAALARWPVPYEQFDLPIMTFLKSTLVGRQE